MKEKWKSIFIESKGKICTVLMISMLVLKYAVLWLMKEYFNLQEWHIYIRILIAISLPILDLTILLKERKIIWNKEISISKHFFNYIFWQIFIIDCAIPLSAIVGKEISNMLLEYAIYICMFYIMLDLLVFPTKAYRWEKGNRNFPLLEWLKVVIFYYSIPLYIIYNVLSSSDDIILLLFSGAIVVFYKWFYSTDFLYFNQSKEKEYNKLIASEKIKMLFKEKLGIVKISVIGVNIAFVFKKIFLKKLMNISNSINVYFNKTLDQNFILNIIVTMLALIIAAMILFIIKVKGKLYIKENYEKIEIEPIQNNKRKRLDKINKKYCK